MNGFIETLDKFISYQGLGLYGIVHIGAGTCEELPYYMACDPEYLVLVDADEQTCHELREETKEVGFCRVICQAVSITGKPLKLNQFNNARLNSVLPLDKFNVHYPGLKQVNTINYPSIPLDDFLKTLDLPDNEPNEKVNILFLDNCGLGMEVFEREKCGELYFFNYIVIRTLGEPDLLKHAAHKNEHELIQVDTLNLPFVDQVYKSKKLFNNLFHENSALKSLLDERERELERRTFSLETVSDELDSSYSQLKEAASANARLYEELSEYQQAREAFENQVKSLAQDAAVSYEKLLESQAKVKDWAQKHSLLKSSLDEKDVELKRHQHLYENLSSEFESISSEFENATSSNALLEDELYQSRKNAAALENQVRSLKKEIAVSDEKRLESETQIKRLIDKISSLEASIKELKKENQEINSVRQMLDQEIIKIEAQLELVRDVVLREKKF